MLFDSNTPTLEFDIDTRNRDLYITCKRDLYNMLFDSNTPTLQHSNTPLRDRNSKKSARYGVATISRLLKIIGLFYRYRLFDRALLQKRPVILKSLLLEATPC